MAKLVSSWYKEVRSLPESYILPPEERPGHRPVPVSNQIPVVDLQAPDSAQLILDACQEFGFFQVINHGVGEELMEDGMKVFEEFFAMEEEAQIKADLYSDTPTTEPCVVSTSSGNDVNSEKVHFWRDVLRHSCHPLDEYLPFWPQKPHRYREVVGECSVEVRKLGLRILEQISQGLGLGNGYLDEFGKFMYLQVNHYPPCPDPTLTLGVYKHVDPTILTILRQDSYGLQVLKEDGQWIGVQPIPNAFVVNVGHQLQIISNGKLKSAEHRAVTNSSRVRTSGAFFLHPDGDTIVEPAKALVSAANPPLYRAFRSMEFVKRYSASRGDVEETIKAFVL